MRLPKLKRVFVILGLLTAIEVSLVGYIGIWREHFWAAVQARDLHTFLLYTVYFSGAALTICLVSGYSQYLAQYAALLVRRKLTRKALKIVQSGSTDGIDTVSQRVQEDCFSYPQILISLTLGLIKSIIILVVYLSIIYHQMGAKYLLIPIVYSIIGTFSAGWLARPLIVLNYINQAAEAKFRATLNKLDYNKVNRNNYNIMKTTKQLTYFQSFWSQISVIIPYLILAPAYFGSVIVFGVLMQVAASIAQSIDCMSFVTNSFNDINRGLSCHKRLKELKII